MEVIAVEPSAVLKLDFETTRLFTRKHEIFGLNLTRLIAGMVRDVLLSDKQPKKPALVTVFHESRCEPPIDAAIDSTIVRAG